MPVIHGSRRPDVVYHVNLLSLCVCRQVFSGEELRFGSPMETLWTKLNSEWGMSIQTCACACVGVCACACACARACACTRGLCVRVCVCVCMCVCMCVCVCVCVCVSRREREKKWDRGTSMILAGVNYN